ncbi:acetamidase/formamidase family protein [Ancylobacter vacuolatus]|uniref:Acetamidase/formamidase/AraC-like DNA-binding protein n=1 Tax=Ancylobacter vacuolatus TaxID=223389 RepID=A0ABU0DHA1_9HYPH|nr:acetamidase/formamidase family protein [Ancylobacter vacuolatus]MDQ0347806.1 acetamidase/formamidase/AraC-like DNA-binding protein [Ancylobacter vacuolatus]
MNAQPFTSESYSGDAGEAAWQDVLRGFGLQSQGARHGSPAHASALSRLSSSGVRLGKFSADAQSLRSLPPSAGLPLLLIPVEHSTVLVAGDDRQIVATGQLILAPRGADWQLQFQRGLRAVVLSVPAEAFRGRKVPPLAAAQPRVFGAEGLPDIVGRTALATAEALDRLSESEWEAVAQSAAELLLALSSELVAATSDPSSSRAALLQRLYATIERSIGSEDISIADIAQAEGISERYVQKLFEGTGESFSHYLRERRLQRAWHDLANPAEAAVPIAEIAYRCGFADAAHFSRLFRERFGLPPRELRRREVDRQTHSAVASGQRGWPQEALVQLRARQVASGPVRRPALREDGEVGTPVSEAPARHYLPVHAQHVHWGYFSRSLEPLIEIASGDIVTVETLTQHASDDPERMIEGDPGAESVFHWTSTDKTVNRRGAGPLDASVFGRGAGEGFGVHICTGPIAVHGAQPGDVLEVHILDIVPRRSRHPAHAGRVFGSSVAAWWGYHYSELLSEPHPRECVTIYEIVTDTDEPYARALHSYRWEPQTDPSGVQHMLYDYPGVLVRPGTVTLQEKVLNGVRIPLRPHFGVIAVAPREAELVDSVPPAYFGGNLDNWRLGKGARVYLPVSVPGALLSVGDPHAAQGDGELSGTAIECSMTGTFCVTLHKKANIGGTVLADLTYPLIETPEDWVLTGFSHPNYLAEFGASSQSEVYAKSSLDLAMRDAFRKMRRFLMSTKALSEDEAVALMSAAVDFGITQVVDGNWGVHAILSKRLFAQHEPGERGLGS